jgi:HPr kinase/phosphorylase
MLPAILMNVAGSITARNLFNDLQDRLQLRWLAGPAGDEGHAISRDDLTVRPAAVGFLNLIHPNKVQILGLEEIDYLDGLDEQELAATVSRIFASAPLAVIVGDGLPMQEAIFTGAGGGRTALLSSDLRAHELVNYLQYHIARSLARRTTLHGVFMEVFTIGVLITGHSGTGKSELALELLNRGHRLIADDAPEFTQISPDVIDGTCPEALQDCLEVRGLGVLNVRHMFGDSAVKANKFLRLIIHLEIPVKPYSLQEGDRLHGDTSLQTVLDLEIPRITLPVMAGRNLAVLTEAAVRDFMLKMKGYDAATAFIERHARLLRSQSEGVAD